MYPNDFDRFRIALETHGEVFSKPVTDKLAAAYWEALKDQHIAAFERASAQHLRFGKFFPKPVELRPKGDKPPEPQDEKAINASVEAAIETWEKLRRDDPKKFWRQFASAYLGRLEFRFKPDSHEYRDAQDRCLTRCNAELKKLGEQRIDLSETKAHVEYRNFNAPVTALQPRRDEIDEFLI